MIRPATVPFLKTIIVGTALTSYSVHMLGFSFMFIFPKTTFP